ncbi:transcriptional regulator, DeoR family [Thermanaerovibrio acidaminovorans DSM 6589]|jgi:DeoR family fructose operon transcriptional repressor|uniref:Transcriptional regulator, DeoR family n=1 Tax=Thermanaerovibrio acidaminovorans (strain ATCC 49978 / DSM 6589 / Su883) TaxID=525903 RepID=D1B7D7_THEAS|nr:DeoR/GlpR family DNA-binding transcription regulator [Thermanaerovibrio acidaminovorans]ACZ19928.1 transcriptional regulator, DeoR family [Thermanaerovibrio acidaminovorans DSM 6589]
MLPEERRSAILALVGQGISSVPQIAHRVGASEATVRRDLAHLEERGLLRRTHGGALPVGYGAEPSFKEKRVRNLEEKRAIGTASAGLVEDGERVLIDAGTTTMELARGLLGRRITVATNSLDVAQVFMNDPVVELWVIGGVMRKSPRSLVGFLADMGLEALRFDVAFIGANGVSAPFGASTPNPEEARTKALMIRSAARGYLLVDHSKLGRDSACRMFPLEELTGLVTDWGADDEEVRALSRVVKVLRAGEDGRWL